MKSILQNTLAVVAGLVIGSIVNMAIVTVGPKVIPLPEGVDMSDTSDMAKFAENLKLFKPENFVAPWLAHALGTLVGAFVAAKVAACWKMPLALFVGVTFLAGGIAMIVMVGGPVWFMLLDLIGAYLPMGYVGGLLAGAGKRRSS